MIEKQLIYENHQQNEIFCFDKLNVSLSIEEAASFLLSITKIASVGSADEPPPKAFSKAVTGIKQQ